MERRRCERFTLPEATVDWASESGPRLQGTRCPLQDLSRGGARYLAEHPPVSGTRVRLRLCVPEAPVVIELHGRVVWSLVSTGHVYNIAIEFAPYGTTPDDNAPEALEGLIALEAHFLKRQP